MKRKRALVIVLWVGMFVGWILWQRHAHLGPVAATQRLIDGASGRWWAVVAFVVLSVVRPLVLFPATLLTVAAGLLFGPIVGVAVAVLGANASALVGWAVARWFAPESFGAGRAVVNAWTERLNRNSFEAVLLMRLVFLPYDLVNYGCGLLKVRWRPFLLATAIGSLPGTIAFVLAGASVKRLDDGFGGVSAPTAIVSVVLVVLSLIASRLLKRARSAGTHISPHSK